MARLEDLTKGNKLTFHPHFQTGIRVGASRLARWENTVGTYECQVARTRNSGRARRRCGGGISAPV